MEYNRLADIFVDLEAKMIANQKALFTSFPNSSLSNLSEFQRQMYSNRNTLEKANINAVNRAYDLARDCLDKSIDRGYKQGVNNISKQLKKDIDNALNERVELMRENSHQFIKSMCRVAVSSAMSIFTNIISSLSAYNYANDLYQAIDYAQSQDLEKGIIGNIKLNGASTNIATVADIIESEYEHGAMMAGEGHARDEAGEFYVVVSSHFGCCEKCARWEGRVIIDDFNAKGKPDGIHPLYSEAMKDGLFHPNCRHRTFVALNGQEKKLRVDIGKDWSEEKNRRQYQATQKQRLIERQIRANKRLEQGSLTQSEQMKYHQQVLHYQKMQREFIKEVNKNDEGIKLFREYEREQVDWNSKPRMADELKELAEKEGIYDINYLKLPYDEKSAIMQYTGGDAYRINSALLEYGENNEYKETIKNLNNALEKMPKVENVTLTRDMKFRYKEEMTYFIDKHILGKEIEYKSFTSTTTKEFYLENPQVRITILNAKRAANLSNINKAESEALYKTNTKFKVLFESNDKFFNNFF